jgi:hypothetical protein
MLDDLTGGQMPIFCTDSQSICLWLDGDDVYGQYGNSTVNSTFTGTANEWISLVYIYDESG